MTKPTLKQLLIITMVCFSFTLFAKGSDERNGIFVKDDAGEVISITSENKFGKTAFIFQNTGAEEEVEYMLYKSGGIYRNQYGEPLENQTAFNEIFSNFSSESENVIDLDGKEAKTLKTSTDLQSIDEILLSQIRIDKDRGITLQNSFEEIELSSWKISEEGSIFQIKTKVDVSFFEGERDLFSELFPIVLNNGLSYEEKVIFFMSTFFTSEIENSDDIVSGITATSNRDVFILEACKYIDNASALRIPSITDVFTSSNFSSLYPKLLRAQNAFKGAFYSHFRVNSEDVAKKEVIIKNEASLPYLDINKDSFDSIYSRGSGENLTRNPYITAYLSYIALEKGDKKSKPILSYLINKNMNEGKILNKIKYDYTLYRQVTDLEGASIARAALRYMTWGVEYTPYSRTTLANNKADNMVYAENYIELDNWVKKENLNPNKRSSNYFNGEIKSIEKPSYFLDQNSVFGNDDSKNFTFESLYDNGSVTTPFKNGYGNPIPYVQIGIDTPKTFNYKMLKQNEARLWMLKEHPDDQYVKDNFPNEVNGILTTTLANDKTKIGDIRYQNGYLNEFVANTDDNSIEPFLPGLTTFTSKGYDISYNGATHPNKTAGVDSLGLLMGSLSMAEVNGTFLNVFNTEVSDKLDEYNRSEPKYHITNSNNILNKPYRFSKSDIERSTILLPDLSMARPGDILVNFSKSEPHIGIIVLADFQGLTEASSAEEYMERITVVSTKSGYQMANVGVWLNPGNVLSGFTAPGDEKSYHLRRLVTLPTDVDPDNNYVKDEFEVFDQELFELYINLEKEKINNKVSHWIPNTGELLKFTSIEITGNYITKGDGSGEKSKLLESDSDIIILPPLDQYYFETESEPESNIYRNKGKGLKFYVIDQKDDAILLASFKLKTNPVIAEGESPYDVEYNSDYFNTDGTIKVDNKNRRLYVENNKLKFKDDGFIFWKFAIRPYDRDNIKPGDDFLLRFGLAKNNQILGVANEEDFVAIYDKKLLWRANLFISETKDWNDFNSWNAPINVVGLYGNSTDHPLWHGFNSNSEEIWFGPNEWNYFFKDANSTFKYTGSEFGSEPNKEDLSELTPGDGKQVVSIPNSVFYNPGSALNRVVSGYTSYNFARTSTPFEYKYQIESQDKIMSDNTVDLEDNWFNYSDTSYRPGLKDVSRHGDIPYTYGSPQIPFKQPSKKVNEPQMLEAGIDCGGLLYASEMYEDTPYIRRVLESGEMISAQDGSRQDSIHDAGAGTEAYDYPISNNTYIIMEYSDYDDETGAEPENRKMVIPGDIIYYTKDSNYHVMLVHDVIYSNDTRNVTLDGIKIIESTHSGLIVPALYGVGNDNKLDFYHTEKKKKWLLGRIKTK